MDLSALEQTEKILNQLMQSGVSELDILQQIYTFRHGVPYIRLVAPCTIANGTIHQLTDAGKIAQAIARAEEAIAAGRVMKFVPASGAATRMFKSLSAVIHNHTTLPYQELRERSSIQADYRFTLTFYDNLEHLALYDELAVQAQRYSIDLTQRTRPNIDTLPILRLVTEPHGLGYAHVPKGLITFHRYPTHTRSAFEEHLQEALHYALYRTEHGYHTARIHFTVSPEHREIVQQHINRVRSRYEQGDIRLVIELSEQKRSTNTVAVTPDNEPFLTEDGLHFRPAGHGALLENLNDVRGDIIFIKNIDNVVPDHLKEETYRYKKILCGIAILLQERIFSSLRLLSSGTAQRSDAEAIADFGERQFAWYFPVPRSSYSDAEFIRLLIHLLDRPLRVCGMVKNEGEPGGGPFIVEAPDGTRSLQIVESAQVDCSNPEQRAILQSSTHFNPVDIVCAVRNVHGECFNLLAFRDNNTGFITLKSSNGRELKALELPGLWNGSMAHWNTVFVEVPSSTFYPVKTINDLLRPEHRTL
ncbi:MAG: DUF4301 family protein [Bacteroidota bacterium]|nr:DUF4301 family protein [Candidatus Kapabacteria bacterium]MDW8220693.1 DUF4301 family protein [Bacteroidota bacterium]